VNVSSIEPAVEVGLHGVAVAKQPGFAVLDLVRTTGQGGSGGVDPSTSVIAMNGGWRPPLHVIDARAEPHVIDDVKIGVSRQECTRLELADGERSSEEACRLGRWVELPRKRGRERR
jgi:hypothetical protein